MMNQSMASCGDVFNAGQGIDHEELEQIAVVFDKIRDVRSTMPENDDRMLAD